MVKFIFYNLLKINYFLCVMLISRYLIDSRWFKQWQKYVGYTYPYEKGKEASIPGPIDNTGLFAGMMYKFFPRNSFYMGFLIYYNSFLLCLLSTCSLTYLLLFHFKTRHVKALKANIFLKNVSKWKDDGQGEFRKMQMEAQK